MKVINYLKHIYQREGALEFHCAVVLCVLIFAMPLALVAPIAIGSNNIILLIPGIVSTLCLIFVFVYGCSAFVYELNKRSKHYTDNMI